LDMTNFCNRFIPNYATLTEPLRRLTKKETAFAWQEEQQTTLDSLKNQFSPSTVMAFYNPTADTKLIVDAGPVGLGAILSQEPADGTYKPIAYGSRALTDIEQRYSQTEKEALDVLWGCEHFHYYVYDRKIGNRPQTS